MSATNTTVVIEEIDDGPYGYTPTLSVCIIFIVLFSISGLLHLFQSIKYRMWWLIPTMFVGCLGEVAGWAGRAWSSQNVTLLNPFLIQICCTIFSPSFMSAANFTILGLIIRRLGVQYSWLTPRWYLIIFITLDVAALVVQSIGGAQAASAAGDDEDPSSGGHIMLYGIVVQMIALAIYSILGAEFITRYLLDKPVRAVPIISDSKDSEDGRTFAEKNGRPHLDRNTKIMLVGLIINTIFLLIRGVYRTIELNDGWDGPVITNQLLFNVLDGMPITICTFIFNFIHPGHFLKST